MPEIINTEALGEILNLDRAGFRQWLLDNHDTAKECRILVSNGDMPAKISYLDAVEEALCFGWIDSTHHRIEGLGSVQRFSPRKPTSRFTRLNLARCERLESLGLMTDAGRKVMPKKGYRPDRYVLKRIRDDPELSEKITSFPKLYVEIRIDNIQVVRGTDPKLYKLRLGKFIDSIREGQMYGKWDDDGRLPHEPLFTMPPKQ